MGNGSHPSGRGNRLFGHVAAAVLLVVFVIARVTVITTSYDAVANWEEPVFLFSATELPQVGWQHLFAHQDDLNHGGSLPLIVLCAAWVKLFGTSLAVLKGVAVLWSALTLVALMAVAWRFYSPQAAMLLGALYTCASPALARMNVTLVGSHPESVLPCTLLLGVYLELQRRQKIGGSRRWWGFALGLLAGLSLWMAYVSLMWVAALGLSSMVAGIASKNDSSGQLLPPFPKGGEGDSARWNLPLLPSLKKRGQPIVVHPPFPKEGQGDSARWHLTLLPSLKKRGHLVYPHPVVPKTTPNARRQSPVVLFGFLVGVSPWLVQNVWLRPHGAALWRRDALASTSPRLIAGLGESFGFGSWLDATVCLGCLVALLIATVRLIRADALARQPGLPSVLAAWIGLALLAAARPPAQEGWYGARFFVPEQVALFWCVAFLAGDAERPIWRVGVFIVAACLGLTGLWPLVNSGNSYVANATGDREKGCGVYGLAELPRAGDIATAVRDLERIKADGCRARAFGGLGWGIAGQALESNDYSGAARIIAEAIPVRWRKNACGGYYFMVLKNPEVTAAVRDIALAAVKPVCESGVPAR